MHITFTDSAKQQLSYLYDGNVLLSLVYDTEGCGCAVNGVPTLWLVSEAESTDSEAEAEPFKVIYSPKHEIFFEENLKIDYDISKKSYILKSNNQIYNASMNLIDKRIKSLL